MTSIQSDIYFQVDGQVAAPNSIRVPPMSLSSARAKMVAHTFRLEIPLPLLCAASAKAWGEYVANCKAEDEKSGGPDKDDWVAMAGYPALDRVLADPDELSFLFGTGGRLVHSVLPELLGQVDPPEGHNLRHSHYYLDGWAVEKGDQNILWVGDCYSKYAGND